MNYYSIRHLTRFRYSHPISESIMEARMHPRSDSNQHCLNFSLSVSPRCRVFSYRDHQGNTVQHFDIPGEHHQLVIVAESVIEQQALPDVPASLSPGAWEALDHLVEEALIQLQYEHQRIVAAGHAHLLGEQGHRRGFHGEGAGQQHLPVIT